MAGFIKSVYFNPVKKFSVVLQYSPRLGSYLVIRHVGCKGLLNTMSDGRNVCGGCKEEFRSPCYFTPKLWIDESESSSEAQLRMWLADWLDEDMDNIGVAVTWT